jgi:hypothetical protein
MDCKSLVARFQNRTIRCDWGFKGIESILFLKNGLKKKFRKKYKNHLRSNNYKVCTAVPNILDAIVLENINLSGYQIGQTALGSNETELYFC